MSQEFKKNKVYTVDDITEPVYQSNEMRESNPTFDIQMDQPSSWGQVSIDDDELQLTDDQIIILDEIYQDLQSENLENYRLVE